MCVTYQCKFMVSEETTVPVFISAFIIHHTPTLPLCNIIMWFTMGGLSFWKFTCPLRWEISLPLNTMSVVIMSPSCSPWSYQFISCIMKYVWDFVNHSCLTWTQIRQFVEFRVDTDPCFLCKSSRWFPWTYLQSNANFAQSFLTTCLLYVQFFSIM